MMRLVARFLIDDDDAKKPPGLVRESMYMMRYSKVKYIPTRSNYTLPSNVRYTMYLVKVEASFRCPVRGVATVVVSTLPVRTCVVTVVVCEVQGDTCSFLARRYFVFALP